MRAWAAAFAACALLWSQAGAAAEPLVLLGEPYQVAAGDNLADVARAHGLGYVELLAANPGLDPWAPPEGATLMLPTTHIAPRRPGPGLLVNLGDMRLYFAPADGGAVASFPIGIGREGRALPATTTRVAGKRARPSWTPPASIRAEKPWLPAVVPPGPDNPLGAYSLDLALDLVRIHGTNLPDGVGRRTSHGCLRLYPEDIARLFPRVPVGTRVTILDQPAKLAWIDGALWLEAHPDGDQADSVEDRRPLPARTLPGLDQRVTAAAGAEAARIDWDAVRWAEAHRPGLPVRIVPAPLDATGRALHSAASQSPARSAPSQRPADLGLHVSTDR